MARDREQSLFSSLGQLHRYLLTALLGTLLVLITTRTLPRFLGGYRVSAPISVNRSTPQVAPPLTGLQFSAAPGPQEFLRTGLFDQPLVPVRTPSADDNQALAQALIAYQRAVSARGPDAVEDIGQFVTQRPGSAWTPILLLNLGTKYRQTGHYSKALATYQQAWAQTKGLTDRNGTAIADMAVAQLSQFEAFLGRTELLEPLLGEIKDRPLHGAATELISDSYRGLSEMHYMPQTSFRCGPMALARILYYKGKRPPDSVAQILEHSYSTPHGLSLATVRDISAQVGLNYQMAFRPRGAPIVSPSVVHWGVGHYAAIVDRVGKSYLVEDSTFGDNVYMSAATLDEEASGYFLIPPGPLPAGWRAVSIQEGQVIWGRGNTGSNTDFGDTGAEATPAFGDEFSSQGNPDDGDQFSSGAPLGGSGPSIPSVPSVPSAPSGPGAPSLAPNANSAGNANTPDFSCGCTTWNVDAMVVGLSLHDAPVGYRPPIGPLVQFQVQYSQRDALQPMTFTYSNLGAKWTFNWLSYVTDERTSAGIVDLYERRGGDEKFSFTSGTTSQPGMYSQSTLSEARGSSGQTIGFTRHLPDGSTEQFNLAVGSQYFLTKLIDPQGNAVKLTYDTQLRLVALTDAIGQVTTLSYGLASDPLKITQVTDPFGRSAKFTYNSGGYLSSITDMLGITSSFVYGANDFVTSLTTPYGTTGFTYGDPSTDSALSAKSERYITATDTLGRTSRVEFNQQAPDVSTSCVSPPNIQPANMSTDCTLLIYRNTYVWDPYQLTYGSSNGQPNYNNALILHWLHTAPDLGLGDSTSRVLESVVRPGEDRIWYNYPNQQAYTTTGGYVPAPTATGASNQPTAIGRVLHFGTQLYQASYNTTGHLTRYTDPAGRSYTFTYADNGIDLLSAANTTAGGNQLLSTYTYNSQHEPLTYVGPNGKASSFGYNAAGQLLSYTDQMGNTTSYSYDSNGYLTTIQEPIKGAQYNFTYDAEGRVATSTDPVGYSVQYAYDAADRLTSTIFPDRSDASFTYHLLDLVASSDRLGHTTNFSFDSERELTQITDALNNTVKLAYCPCGIVSSLTDPLGNVTSFTRDQGERITQKQFADGSVQKLTYDFGSSLVTETQTQLNGAIPFQSQYTYNKDGSLAMYTSVGAQTAYASYTYDSVYPRLASVQDSHGNITFNYYPVSATPALGANLLRSVISTEGNGQSDTVTYTYDALNRRIGQTIDGAAESWSYDALGRITSDQNALDTFSYSYADESARVTGVTSAHGPNASLVYYGSSGDELLKQIAYTKAGGVALATYKYTYDSNDSVTAFTESYIGQQLAALMTNHGPLARSLAHALVAAPSGTAFSPTWYSSVGVMAFGAALVLILFGLLRSEPVKRRLLCLIPVVLATLIASSCGGGSGGSSSVSSGTGSSGSGSGDAASSGGSSGGASSSSSSGSGAAAGVTISYAYDAASQLLSATSSTGVAASAAYTYDAASNLTTISNGSKTTTLSYGSTNALSIGGAGADADGNTTTLAGTQYTWDGQDRLYSAKVPGATSGSIPLKESDFTYDGLNRLVRIVDKQNGMVTADHSYFWCGAVRCLQRDNTQPQSPVSEQYFSQGVIAAGQSYYYVTDRQGSVRQYVDVGGNVRAQYEYDAYGNRTKIGGDLDSDMGYSGLFNHAATGLDFALFRAYNPQYARWLNRDPIGEAGGGNLYAYADNLPSTLGDSSGLEPWFSVGPGGISVGPVSIGLSGISWGPVSYGKGGIGLGGADPVGLTTGAVPGLNDYLKGLAARAALIQARQALGNQLNNAKAHKLCLKKGALNQLYKRYVDLGYQINALGQQLSQSSYANGFARPFLGDNPYIADPGSLGPRGQIGSI